MELRLGFLAVVLSCVRLKYPLAGSGSQNHGAQCLHFQNNTAQVKCVFESDICSPEYPNDFYAVQHVTNMTADFGPEYPLRCRCKNTSLTCPYAIIEHRSDQKALILSITNLTKTDFGLYVFEFRSEKYSCILPNIPNVKGGENELVSNPPTSVTPESKIEPADGNKNKLATHEGVSTRAAPVNTDWTTQSANEVTCQPVSPQLCNEKSVWEIAGPLIGCSIALCVVSIIAVICLLKKCRNLERENTKLKTKESGEMGRGNGESNQPYPNDDQCDSKEQTDTPLLTCSSVSDDRRLVTIEQDPSTIKYQEHNEFSIKPHKPTSCDKWALNANPNHAMSVHNEASDQADMNLQPL